MSKGFFLFAVLLFIFGVVIGQNLGGFSPRYGTPLEAEMLLERAVQLMDTSDDKAEVYEKINNDDAYKQHDLYVFIADKSGNIVAHGVDKERIGKSLLSLQDSSGRAFGRKMVLSANEEGVWVPYLWKHPTTGEEAWKLSLVRRAKNGEVLGVGVYLPPQ